MKKIILHKYHNPDRLFGGYGWSMEEVWDDWKHIYSDPYEVEIPDNFSIGKSNFGEEMFFKDNCNMGYDLGIDGRYNKNGKPYLVGGSPVEMVFLNVIGKCKEIEAE